MNNTRPRKSSTWPPPALPICLCSIVVRIVCDIPLWCAVVGDVSVNRPCVPLGLVQNYTASLLSLRHFLRLVRLVRLVRLTLYTPSVLTGTCSVIQINTMTTYSSTSSAIQVLRPSYNLMHTSMHSPISKGIPPPSLFLSPLTVQPSRQAYSS